MDKEEDFFCCQVPVRRNGMEQAIECWDHTSSESDTLEEENCRPINYSGLFPTRWTSRHDILPGGERGRRGLNGGGGDHDDWGAVCY